MTIVDKLKELDNNKKKKDRKIIALTTFALITSVTVETIIEDYIRTKYGIPQKKGIFEMIIDKYKSNNSEIKY